MGRICFLFAIACMSATSTFGQAASKNDIEEILSSKIRVLRNIQELPDQKIMGKLKGKHDLLKKHIDYTNAIRQLNDTFIKTFTDVWKFSKYDTTLSYFNSWGKTNPSGLVAYLDFGDFGGKDETTGVWGEPRFLYVVIAEYKNGKHKKSFGSMGIPISPTYIDFFHAITFIQNHFEAVNEGKWKSLTCFLCIPDFFRPLQTKDVNLADFTLLVDRKYLDKELTADNFKNYYPYKFEISYTDEIRSAIIANDKRFIFMAPSFVLEDRATGKEVDSYTIWYVFHVMTTSGSLVSYDLGARVKKMKLDCILKEEALKNFVKRD